MERRKIIINDPTAEARYKDSKITRPYNIQEMTLLSHEQPSGSVERLVQIINRIQIDDQRYAEAATDNPEMSDHFTRLRDIGIQAITGWKQFYEDEHGVSIPTVVSYDGTESWQDMVILALQSNQQPISHIRENLPA